MIRRPAVWTSPTWKARSPTETAAVYVEQPGYLGAIDPNAARIAEIARAKGAETIVGVDPLSLGLLKAPGDYGADIVVGPTQPMGVHMNCGGGVGGFMASRDEEKYVREFNGFLVSIAETQKPGQFGFGLASAHQTSYGMREEGKDWTGNSVYLWAIANAVYMSLLGPQGFRELGELIISRSHYAARRLGARSRASKSLRPTDSSRNSRSTSREPAKRYPRSTPRCAEITGSSAARISQTSCPGLAGARSTASPKFIPRKILTGLPVRSRRWCHERASSRLSCRSLG